MNVSIRRLTSDTPMPEYKTPGACAFDLAVIEAGSILPGETTFFRTGLVVAVPAGHVLLLAPRSSNAKKSIRLANTIGVVDQDYCGPNDEIKLAFHNFGATPYNVEKGERLAQALLLPIAQATFMETELNTQTNRGGFGTTG